MLALVFLATIVLAATAAAVAVAFVIPGAAVVALIRSADRPAPSLPEPPEPCPLPPMPSAGSLAHGSA